MKLHITVKQQNPEFDQQYANQYHFGKESDGNWKYNLNDGYEVRENIKEFTILDEENFKLAGQKKIEEFEILIPNMTVINCLTADNRHIQVAAISKSLIKKKQITPNKKYDLTRIYFYLTEQAEFIHPFKIIYIAPTDFPKELLKKQS